MDAIRLTEIRKRWEGATRGPWTWFDCKDSSAGTDQEADVRAMAATRKREIISLTGEGDYNEHIVLQLDPCQPEWAPAQADAAFIAYAWEDIRDLLAYVHRLEQT